MKYIYRDNYTEEVYKALYDFIDERVEFLTNVLNNKYPKNEFFELEYGYEIWMENTYIRAMESTGYQIEDPDLDIEIQEELTDAFSLLQDEVDWHNEQVRELRLNERH